MDAKPLLPVYALYDPKSQEVLLVTKEKIVPIKEDKDGYTRYDAEVFRFFSGGFLVRYSVLQLSESYLKEAREPESDKEKELVGRAFRRYLELHPNAMLFPISLRSFVPARPCNSLINS